MLALWIFASTKMMKSFLFISVFISTYIIVQGTEQQSTGSQCQCCDQCDQSATVSKILLDISNLLVNDDQANTTSSPPTTVNPTTADSITTSTTQSPSTIIYSSDIRDSHTTVTPSTTTSSITEPSTKTESYTTINEPTVTNPPSLKTSKTITDSTGKMSVCPENCTLDISGEYCNCYLPTEAKRTDADDRKELGVASLPV